MIYALLYIGLLITIILINIKFHPMKQLSEEQENIILELISNHALCEPEHLTPETRLENDLTLDSLDIVELIMRVEQEFNIQIADSDIESTKTIQDVFNRVAEQL